MNSKDSRCFLGAFGLVSLIIFVTAIFSSLPFYTMMHDGIPHPYDGGLPMPGMPMAGVVIIAYTLFELMISVGMTMLLFAGLLFILDGLRAGIAFIGQICCKDEEEGRSLLPDKKAKKKQQYDIV